MRDDWYMDAAEEEHYTGSACPNCNRLTLIEAIDVEVCNACDYGFRYN